MMGRSPGQCSKIFQTVTIIVLGVVFLRFFGFSTFEKWERQDVQIVRRTEGRSSLPAPAVTICPAVATFPAGRSLSKTLLSVDDNASFSEGRNRIQGHIQIRTILQY